MRIYKPFNRRENEKPRLVYAGFYYSEYGVNGFVAEYRDERGDYRRHVDTHRKRA